MEEPFFFFKEWDKLKLAIFFIQIGIVQSGFSHFSDCELKTCKFFLRFESELCNFNMEHVKSKQNGLKSHASAFRCFMKQHTISSTLSVPIRIAPAWGRMLRFGNNTKFKSDDFYQVINIYSTYGLFFVDSQTFLFAVPADCFIHFLQGFKKNF